MKRILIVASLAILLTGCGGTAVSSGVLAETPTAPAATVEPTKAPTDEPESTPTSLPSPSTPPALSGAPAEWLAAICGARDASINFDTATMIRAASALDAAPAWPEGDVVRDPLRLALDHSIEQSRSHGMDEVNARIAAFDAWVVHSDAASALFGSAEAMCG